MATFNVYGPYEIPFQKIGKRWHKRTDRTALECFWENEASQVVSMRGCYIFAMKAGPGYMPYYVGKAEKQPFKKECFQSFHRADHYDPVLAIRQGTPVMFFISQGKGPWNMKQIGEIEKYLIARVAAKNRNLTNIKGTSKETWKIKGVIGAGRGKASKESGVFKKTIGL